MGDVHGEVGKDDDGVLRIRRLHVSYRLKAGEEHRDTIERVHALHADRCPVYRTLVPAFEITTSYELVS